MTAAWARRTRVGRHNSRAGLGGYLQQMSRGGALGVLHKHCWEQGQRRRQAARLDAWHVAWRVQAWNGYGLITGPHPLPRTTSIARDVVSRSRSAIACCSGYKHAFISCTETSVAERIPHRLVEAARNYEGRSLNTTGNSSFRRAELSSDLAYLLQRPPACAAGDPRHDCWPSFKIGVDH